MISKYTHFIKINSNCYAVYNSFVMEPIFVTSEKAKDIKNGCFSNLSEEELNMLKEVGVFINDTNFDTKLLELYQNTFNNMIKNKVTIMYLIPTNSCNLMCKYCFIGQLNKEPKLLSITDAKRAVDLFGKHLNKIQEQGQLFFYGGEPLLNFNLIKEVVNYSKLKKYNIEFSMVSNGLLITERIANFIKENKISLGISIDGPKSVNDSNRIFKDSNISVYDKVLEKIVLLKRMKVDFGLSITIAPIFLKNKESFIQWLEKLDVKNISYNLLHFTEKNNDWKKYYKEATKFIYDSNLRLFKKGYNEDRINRKYKSFFEKNFKFSDCGAIGGNQITICPSGDIEVCHGYWNNDNHFLGNINQIKDISELFSQNYFKKWQSFITLNKKRCLKCKAIYICGGGCAMQSRDVFGKEEKIDRAFCIYSKEILKKILKEIYIDTIKEEE